MPFNHKQIIEQAEFVYSPLGKAFAKQTKKVGAIKSLDLSNEKNELKQTEGTIPQNLMNDLIRDKLQGIVNWQDIKTDDLSYKAKKDVFLHQK